MQHTTKIIALLLALNLSQGLFASHYEMSPSAHPHTGDFEGCVENGTLVSIHPTAREHIYLDRLDLTGYGIQKIEEGPLSEKPLRTVSFGNNKLTTIDLSTFEATTLQSLYLWMNQIKNFRTTNHQLYSRLTLLDLHHNELSDLEGSIFPPSLENLDLSENKLTSIPHLNNLTALQTLSLSANKFSTFDLEKIPTACLALLFLGCNELTQFDIVRCAALCEKLQHVQLLFNPLDDGAMQALHDFYAQQSEGKRVSLSFTNNTIPTKFYELKKSITESAANSDACQKPSAVSSGIE